MRGQTPRGRSRKMLVTVVAACVVVISAVVALAIGLPKAPSGSVAELEYVTNSAYDFANELFAPKLTSLQRDDIWRDYEGRPVQWTSELKDVSLEREEPVVRFINPLNWTRTEVVAVFDESQRFRLDNFKVGDLVTYTGILARFKGTEISLTDCAVVSLPIVPLWWNGDIDTHNRRIMVEDEVLCLGPSTYDDVTDYRPDPAPKITAVYRETGELLWRSEETGSILVGIDSQYVYAWHLLGELVERSEPGDPYYWCRFNITATNITSGQIDWYPPPLSEDVDCREKDDCLPDEWSESDFVDCCVLRESVKDEITGKVGQSGLILLANKPLLSELTYEYQGVIYRSACAVYGGAGVECGALQALDQQTGEVLWMLTFQERGVSDFSIFDGILYVSTDDGVGAFELPNLVPPRDESSSDADIQIPGSEYIP
jgi:hypothetical protein